MYLLSRVLLSLTKSSHQREKERNDAYLAEASDVCDLEKRAQNIDHRASVQLTIESLRNYCSSRC
ncbi:Protein of unknown function [Burkholderia sp. D7]|nr:Protein of unknown function [Burkholderia sp. D7]